MKPLYSLVILGFLFIFSSVAGAVTQTMTLSGHITKPDGTALASTSVQFQFSLSSPTGTCVIYQETSGSLDLSNSNGNFDTALGTGTLIFPTDGRTLKDVLNNSAAIPCLSGGSYTPAATDSRILNIQFLDQNESTPTWRTFTSGVSLSSVPSAFYAGSAEKLGSNVASDFVLKTGIPTCSAGTFLTWDGTTLTCSTAGSNGTVTNVSGTSPLSVATGTTTPVISIAQAGTSTDGYLTATDWNTFNNKQTAGNYLTGLSGDLSVTGPGTVAASIAKLQGRTLTLTTPASGDFIRYNGSAFVNSPLNISDIPNLTWSKITSGTPTTLSGYGITDAVGNAGGSPSIQTGLDSTKPSTPTAGALYFATDTKIIYQYNSGAWIAMASASGSGGTLTALTGDVSANGNGSVAATVNTVGGSSSANIHSAEVLANAATNANSANALVKRDSTGSFAANKISMNMLLLNDSGANSLTLQAPATLTSSYTLTYPAAAGTSNQFLVTDGSGNLSWTSMGSLGITSIGVTSPLQSTGSSSPTLSILQASSSQSGYLSSTDYNTFNAKLSTALPSGDIWVGNGGGAAAAVGPSGDVSMTNAGAFTVKKIQGTQVSGTAPSSAGQVLRYDGSTQYAPNFLGVGDIRSTITPTTAVFSSAACSASQSLYYQSATDTFQCQSIAIADNQITYGSRSANTFLAAPNGSSGAPSFRTIASTDVNGFAFVNGGNSFGSAATFGTTDFNSLYFMTNSSLAMTVDAAGRVAVGSSPPRSSLDVSGTILGKPAISNASTTIDFINGNMQYTTLSCASFTLWNLKDGGSYMFVVKGTTSSMCNFIAYSDAGTTSLTVHMPPDHSFTVAGKQTMYNIAVLGTDVYFSWTPGY